MQGPSLVCNLPCSLQQHQILNPLSKARDRAHIFIDPSQVRFTEPQKELQCWIFLTHCTGPGLKLISPQRQARSLTHCATVGIPVWSFKFIAEFGLLICCWVFLCLCSLAILDYNFLFHCGVFFPGFAIRVMWAVEWIWKNYSSSIFRNSLTRIDVI